MTMKTLKGVPVRGKNVRWSLGHGGKLVSIPGFCVFFFMERPRSVAFLAQRLCGGVAGWRGSKNGDVEAKGLNEKVDLD